MWADVDKDLGELLSEVDAAQANEGSDEEEVLGRYSYTFYYATFPLHVLF